MSYDGRHMIDATVKARYSGKSTGQHFSVISSMLFRVSNVLADLRSVTMITLSICKAT